MQVHRRLRQLTTELSNGVLCLLVPLSYPEKHKQLSSATGCYSVADFDGLIVNYDVIVKRVGCFVVLF